MDRAALMKYNVYQQVEGTVALSKSELLQNVGYLRGIQVPCWEYSGGSSI